jgi:hypothetical protein
MELSHGLLHATIIQFIIDKGFAPDVDELATLLKTSAGEIETALESLADYHGLVLHPNSTKVWVIHPFSLAPTNFLIRTEKGEWWGNCAWCSLGVAALLNQDLSITTTLGADSKQVTLHIENGKLLEKNYFVHFPIPMTKAWENVIYTCSTMLLFEDEKHIQDWSERHRIPKGDIQPVENIWVFAKVWYGNHLNPEWKKWTNREAQEIFQRFGLTSSIWQIPLSDSRF